MASGIDVSRLEEAFGLTEDERREYEAAILTLERYVERHGPDPDTEHAIAYLRELLDRKPLSER